MHAYAGLFAVGGAVMALAGGWRAGRKHGFWHKAPGGFHMGAGAVLAMAGMVGAVAQTLFGSVRWIGLAGAAAGSGLGVLAARRERSRGRDRD